MEKSLTIDLILKALRQETGTLEERMTKLKGKVMGWMLDGSTPWDIGHNVRKYLDDKENQKQIRKTYTLKFKEE